MNALIIKIQLPEGMFLTSRYFQLYKSCDEKDDAIYIIIKNKEFMNPDHNIHKKLEEDLEQIPGASLEYIIRRLKSSDKFRPLFQKTELIK